MSRLAILLISLRALVIAAVAGVPAAHAQQVPGSDEAAWAAAAEADTPEAYQRYLEDFPAGRYAEEAFRLLIESQLEVAAGRRAGRRPLLRAARPPSIRRRRPAPRPGLLETMPE